MILLLGANGYIGQAFARELQRRGETWLPLSRKSLDYMRFDVLFDYVRKTKPQFIINAAGYTGRPNVDACEVARAETVQGNALFPQTVGRVCLMTNTPWGHVSSGCIYSGAKVSTGNNGNFRIERDLNVPKVRSCYEKHPERFHGFTEMDEPNFSFRNPPCSFYSGTKALGEEALRGVGQCYIWRLRIPFDEFDHPKNYLTKIKSYPKVYDAINSLSHRGDFVRACLELKERCAPYGTYNVVNPGAVTTRTVVDRITRISQPCRAFTYWKNDEEFYRCAANAPRSNCILDTTKLLSAGVAMRPVAQALDHSLENWQATAETLRMVAGLSGPGEELNQGVAVLSAVSTSTSVRAALWP